MEDQRQALLLTVIARGAGSKTAKPADFMIGPHLERAGPQGEKVKAREMAAQLKGLLAGRRSAKK